jgi:hypothetical protein
MPDGSKRKVFNVVETEAAKEKITKMKDAFSKWVWKDALRSEKLVRLYNDQYNNLVGRKFDGSHLTLPAASNVVEFRPNQLQGVWRIIADGSTYLAHEVGAGKTMTVVAACMEQKRLGLINKPMVVVPGHTLSQWEREWLMLYPNARILVADDESFSKDKRDRFMARAATDNWDGIIITHSAFKLIPTPADFERRIINETLDSFEDMLASIDSDDRVSRKNLERAKEGLEKKLDALAARKDDMVTIAEIGVDQIVVDEAQEHRKLTFATNMTRLKGVDPKGSQMAWDLYVKSKFVNTISPGRHLILASGTPITNTMGELFTLMRFLFEHGLYERHVHEFDAWASAFCDSTMDLELQASGLYKPVSRLAKFVNVPELIAMFRTKADVVGGEELRRYMKLPRVMGGKRKLVTAPATPAFKAGQKALAARIKIIEARKRPPRKGDDIIPSVINDGRHLAIHPRLYGIQIDEPRSKLDLMIENVFRIWRETRDLTYLRPDGSPYPRKGAAQMIFSDLGTESIEAKRGFSAYTYTRNRLIGLGVPAEQIAIMQHFKKPMAKLKLFADVNAGITTILLGSSQTMGTGVNAQLRLKALHHLDVPWIPAWIGQREGRIERQGNQNEEIEIYAYATLGSVDATMWQTLERKQRFIDAALSGDASIRVLDDVDQADQFAMAKAIASGDPRLMQLAGLEAEVARLRRLEAAHFDDQHAVKVTVDRARGTMAYAEQRIPDRKKDLEIRQPTRGDQFTYKLRDEVYTERSKAGDILLSRIRIKEKAQEEGETSLGFIGGFELIATGVKTQSGWFYVDVTLERTNYSEAVKLKDGQPGVGLVAMIENRIEAMESDVFDLEYRLNSAKRTLADYEGRTVGEFEWKEELAAKEVQLWALKRDLEATREAPVEDEREAG